MKYLILLLSFTLFNFSHAGSAAPLPAEYLASFAQQRINPLYIGRRSFISYYGANLGQASQFLGIPYPDKNNYLLLSRWQGAGARHPYYMVQYFDCQRGEYYHLGHGPSPRAAYNDISAAGVIGPKKIPGGGGNLFTAQDKFLCGSSEISRVLEPARDLPWGLTAGAIPEYLRTDLVCDRHVAGPGIAHTHCVRPYSPERLLTQTPVADFNYGDLHLYFNKNCGLYSASYVEFYETAEALNARYETLKAHFIMRTHPQAMVYASETVHLRTRERDDFSLGRNLGLVKFPDLIGLSLDFYSSCGRGYDRHKHEIVSGNSGDQQTRNELLRHQEELNARYQTPAAAGLPVPVLFE